MKLLLAVMYLQFIRLPFIDIDIKALQQYWALLHTIDIKDTANIDAPKIILLSTVYLFCVYKFTNYKDKNGSKKFRIFNEKYTDSTKTALFKKYDGEN